LVSVGVVSVGVVSVLVFVLTLVTTTSLRNISSFVF
jgi:hypothetical protein